MSYGYIIAAFLFIIWIVVLKILDKKKILEKWNLSRIWGFALMWRTEKGKNIIEYMARPRKFWNTFITFGLYSFYLGMIGMYSMLVLSVIAVITAPYIEPMGASDVLVIPGVNKYIPFIFGMIGLVVAIVAHEFSHGILARAGDFKVKYLGLLFAIIPIGAFMEPDEEEVEKGPRLKRIKMFVAGPLSNFSLAVVFFLLFSWAFMGSLEAPDDPFIITDISKNSPLVLSLDERPQAIYSIDNKSIHTYEDIFELDGPDPGQPVDVYVKIGAGKVHIPSIAGVMIWMIHDESPAGEANITKGSIIKSLDGNIIRNKDQFSSILDDRYKGDTVNLTLLVPEIDSNGDSLVNRTIDDGILPDVDDDYHGLRFPVYHEESYIITLADKYEIYPFDQFKGKGYVGVSTSYLGIMDGEGSQEFIDKLNHPMTSEDNVKDGFMNLMYMTFSLPLQLNVMPFHTPITDIYEVSGPLSILPDSAFWFIANTIFYIFWLNVLLGLFNALPAVPLDGGFVFRDTIVLVLKNFTGKKSNEKVEKIAGVLTTISSFSVLALILITVFFPWIRTFFY